LSRLSKTRLAWRETLLAGASALILAACAPVSVPPDTAPPTPSTSLTAPTATPLQSPSPAPTYEPLVVLGAEWVSARASDGNTTEADLRDEAATVAVITSALGTPAVRPTCGIGPGNEYQWGEGEESFTLFYGEKPQFGMENPADFPPTVLLKTPSLAGVRIENEIGVAIGEPLSQAPADSYEQLNDQWMWHDFGEFNGTRYGANMATDSAGIISLIVLPAPGWGGGICT
jgi:hypothetical protein